MTVVRDVALTDHRHMTVPSLPSDLAAALDARAHGLSRNDAAKRQASISQTYRSGGGSRAIMTEVDALTYALARMPATYAAVAACLNAVRDATPDFAPASLLDCGAGPGTATWCARESFASLTSFALVDANPALRKLALDLARDLAIPSLQYDLADVSALPGKAPPADLVVASYMIGELHDDPARAALADTMWALTTGTLLVVEPGTPDGYRRILAVRARLIAQGAQVVAPCPHDNACPLVAPDWCHFVQRLPRSRAHRNLKGADLPYEDEKFSYVALSRTVLARRPARVLAQPAVTKIAVTSKLCTRDGVIRAIVPRRDKAAYARAKKRNWGDAAIDSFEAPTE